MNGLLVATMLLGAPAVQAHARVAADREAGRPLVAHVVVALCDNDNQGISPVPKALGDGQNPRTNLYWGALYGVRTFLTKKAGWTRVTTGGSLQAPILERLVLHRKVDGVDAYVVADAWDGQEIEAATRRFMDISAGRNVEEIRIGARTIVAGGAAHLVGYVGHNGLMDFSLPPVAAPHAEALPRSAIVLACASKPHFERRLDRLGVHALVLTTNLMAPEAYTIDAIVRKWFAGGTSSEVREAAARTYTRYQKYPLRVGRRLFVGD